MPGRVYAAAIADFLAARRGYIAIGVGLAMLAAGGKFIKDVAAVPTAIQAHDTASRNASGREQQQLDSVISAIREQNRLSREQLCVMTSATSNEKLSCIGKIP